MIGEQISIIVPVYNVEKYLDKSIQSICSQTWHQLEIILIDDGSKDHSSDICDHWAQKDSRIRVIHKANGGLSDARNVGIKAASGKYYMFVDSDDTIAPHTVENLYTAAIKYGCEISVCNIVRIYDNGVTEPFYHPVDQLTVLRGQQRFETLKQPSVCNKLFRAELFKEVLFPKGKFYEDTFIYHVLVYKAKQVVLTGYDGYYYLSRQNSILGQSQYTERYFDFIEAVYTRMTYLLAHGVTYYAEEACLSLYVAVANGEKYIQKTEQNSAKFQQMRNWYRVAYQQLMKSSQTGIKQKFRLILLRYFPSVHNILF